MSMVLNSSLWNDLEKKADIVSKPKTLHIGMSLAPTWLNGDAWRRPDSHVEGTYGSAFHIAIAKAAEAAKLDFVFRPDTLYLDTRALETSPGFGALDPTILLAAVAGETSRIGLLSTVSTTFYPPYVVARQIQSLNWISQGRAGWNIVTALDGNENFGLTAMPSAEERYARAAEFTDIVRRLWDSYPRDALKMDRDSGLYADAARVVPIDHDGPCFKVKGPLNMPAWGESPIPLVQAGASPAGRTFASSVADAIFASAPDMDAAIDLRRDLRARAVGHGRPADAIKVLPGLNLFLAPSRAEAEDLFAEAHARTGKARKFASIETLIGLDLSDWPMDRKVTAADLPANRGQERSRTHSDLLRRLIDREEPTVEALLTKPEAMGSAHWRVIGTPDDAAGEIAAWADAGAMDGFISVPGGSVGSMRMFFDELVPRLRDTGLLRKDYTGETFADHLRD